MQIKDIPINKIKPNPNQPRSSLNEDGLKELAESIKNKGLLEEILVRPKNDYFEIVDGNRRWRAHKLLGSKTIKARIESLSDQEVFEYSFIVNMQRENLNAEDEAQGIKRLIDYGLAQKEVAEKIGKTRDYVAKKLSLLRDFERLNKLVEEGEVNEKEADHLREDVRRRTTSPEVLHQLVKARHSWVRDRILEEAPTVRKAREIAEEAKENQDHKDREEFRKIQERYSVLYEKKRDEYLKSLPQTHRGILENAQEKIEYANKKTKAREFVRKWKKVLYINIFGISSSYVGLPRDPYLNFMNFSWWKARRDWPVEKLVEHSLARLKKLVEMNHHERNMLFESFQREYAELFPDVVKVNIYQVLRDIPEEVWKKIHRSLARNFHPDRGGDADVMDWITKLNEGIKNLREWK